jgi:hypothetical protein
MKQTPLRRKPYTLKRTPLKAKKRTIRKASPLTEAKLKKKLDILFSLYIRGRDEMCLWRKKDGDTVVKVCDPFQVKRLECSHFYPRSFVSVRWDPANCITLCGYHHWNSQTEGWEYSKHDEYRDFIIERLGESSYEALRQRAKKARPFSRNELTRLIEVLKSNSESYENEYSRILEGG